jgi:hypothetical protein
MRAARKVDNPWGSRHAARGIVVAQRVFMRLSPLFATLGLALFTTLVAGCAAPEEEESASSTEAINKAPAPPARRSSLRCSIEELRLDKWPTVEPQRPETKTFVEGLIAKAKNGPFTIVDYGPYQLMSFKVRVQGGASAVAVKLSFFHTLPNNVEMPGEVVWSGSLPGDYEQLFIPELYYDADKYGIGAGAPRYGLNKGRIVVSCSEKGGESSDITSYRFTRAAM